MCAWPPAPTQSNSYALPQARKAGFAELYLVGKGTDKEGQEVVLRGTVRIPGDPGYQETAKMIAETGKAVV